MSNNDIFRSLRYTFDINDFLMIEIFGMAGHEVDRPTVSNWLKKEDDEDFKPLYDKDLAAFLNGFIILKRGKQEGKDPVIEKSLSNNQVLRKLKIALSLIDEDMLNMLKSVNFRLSKHELSAFFRNPTQSQYRDCKDQVLRNFLKGLQVTYRPS
ncbi:DUF1456 family protein [Algoriphagus halophilus]|uniref:DUF1456 family protein n=1 Tax=Algoriphagus halophilus TaxID=226505 RepID=UPI00358F5AF0